MFLFRTYCLLFEETTEDGFINFSALIVCCEHIWLESFLPCIIYRFSYYLKTTCTFLLDTQNISERLSKSQAKVYRNARGKFSFSMAAHKSVNNEALGWARAREKVLSTWGLKDKA